MEPFPTNAVAIEWEFRCLSREFPVLPWDWRCKARDGSLIAKSGVRFRSFAEALSDAKTKGFSYDAIRAPSSSA